MARYKLHRKKVVYFVRPMVRTMWFTLTALLILPVYAGYDQMPDWALWVPLFSIVTALAGIAGFNPLQAKSSQSRMAGEGDQRDSIVVGVR